MNTAPAIRRKSLMDSGAGASGVAAAPSLPKSRPLSSSSSSSNPSATAAATSNSGRGLQLPSSSSSNSRRPTFLITPATAPQGSHRPSVVNYSTYNSNSGAGGGGGVMVLNSRMFENTYRISPEKPFSATAARHVLREVMEEMLEGRQYDTEACKQLTGALADAIKRRIKELGHSRYKLITNVAIGQAGGATLAFASRCVWNDSFDSFAQYTYRNASLYAVGLVHAVYCD